MRQEKEAKDKAAAMAGDAMNEEQLLEHLSAIFRALPPVMRGMVIAQFQAEGD